MESRRAIDVSARASRPGGDQPPRTASAAACPRPAVSRDQRGFLGRAGALRRSPSILWRFSDRLPAANRGIGLNRSAEGWRTRLTGHFLSHSNPCLIRPATWAKAAAADSSGRGILDPIR